MNNNFGQKDGATVHLHLLSTALKKALVINTFDIQLASFVGHIKALIFIKLDGSLKVLVEIQPKHMLRLYYSDLGSTFGESSKLRVHQQYRAIYQRTNLAKVANPIP